MKRHDTKGVKEDRLPARTQNYICLISDGVSIEDIPEHANIYKMDQSLHYSSAAKARALNSVWHDSNATSSSPSRSHLVVFCRDRSAGCDGLPRGPWRLRVGLRPYHNSTFSVSFCVSMYVNGLTLSHYQGSKHSAHVAPLSTYIVYMDILEY